MSCSLKKVILVCVCIAALLVLCACESELIINTELSIDEGFSGTRVMTFTIEDENNIEAREVAALLDEKKPEQVSLQYTTKSDNTVDCVATVSFTSLDDYKTKITALLGGKRPEIEFELPGDNWYYSGVRLSENFSSADLSSWAVKAIEAKYPDAKGRIKVIPGINVLKVNDVEYKIDGGNIDTDFAENLIEKVTVDTQIYGEDEYSRTVAVSIKPESLKAIGKERLESALFSKMSSSIGSFSNFGWKTGENGEEYYYFSLTHGTKDEFIRFTQSVFEGSDVQYEGDIEKTMFSVSGKLSEKLDFSAFRCNADGTTDIVMTYESINSAILENGKGSTVDGAEKDNSLTFDLKSHKKGATFEILNIMTIPVQAIGVSTEVSISGNITTSITVSYPVEGSRSNSDWVAKMAKENEAFKLLDVNSVFGGNETINTENEILTVSRYYTVISASGSCEEITEAFTTAFGEGNQIELTENKAGGSLFYNHNTIIQSVDISSLVTDANYTGSINYSFSGTSSRISNVRTFNDEGRVENDDLLKGETASGSFADANFNKPNFKLSFSYDTLDVMTIILLVLAGGAVLCLMLFLYRVFGKKLFRKREVKKNDIRYEAVKSVALACVPEGERGEVLEMPSELIHRPTIVIKPKNDDGLDEDDDDPEGVILFSMIMRILIMVEMVLFFCPYCTFGSNKIASGGYISGWSIFMGPDICDAKQPPNYFVCVLFFIPLIMLGALLARKVLPRLALPVTLIGGSLFSLFYLTSLSSYLGNIIDEAKVFAMQNGTYVTQPELAMGYKYGIVIFILLAIGGVVLLFSNILTDMVRKRHERDEEMRRFEE